MKIPINNPSDSIDTLSETNESLERTWRPCRGGNTVKINNVNGMIGAYSQNGNRKVSGPKEASRPERTDEVRLSREAQEVMSLKDKVTQAPDIRRERVEELRRQLEAGNYRPDAREVASRMLRARVFDDLA